jgi:hypothetical protein
MGWRYRLTSSELAGQSRNDNAWNLADLYVEYFRETQKSVPLLCSFSNELDQPSPCPQSLGHDN